MIEFSIFYFLFLLGVDTPSHEASIFAKATTDKTEGKPFGIAQDRLVKRFSVLPTK